MRSLSRLVLAGLLVASTGLVLHGLAIYLAPAKHPTVRDRAALTQLIIKQLLEPAP